MIPTQTHIHMCITHKKLRKIGLRDTRMPSLENWGGGLKGIKSPNEDVEIYGKQTCVVCHLLDHMQWTHLLRVEGVDA